MALIWQLQCTKWSLILLCHRPVVVVVVMVAVVIVVVPLLKLVAN